MISLKNLLLEFTPKVRKTRPGAYRVSMPHSAAYGEVYGFVEKKGREWHADVRTPGTGPQRSEVMRHAGIWKNLKDAIEELMFLADK